MEEQHVFQSRAIERGRYDPETRRLTIRRPNGKEYCWDGCSSAWWEGMKRAESAGSFLKAIEPYLKRIERHDEEVKP